MKVKIDFDDEESKVVETDWLDYAVFAGKITRIQFGEKDSTRKNVEFQIQSEQL